MLVRAVQVHGFRDGAPWVGAELGPVAELPPAPAGTALADALSLLFAVLDPESAPSTLRRLELIGDLGETSTDEHGLLEQVVGLDPGAVGALLEDGERKLVVDVALALDPPLYGRLREHALRDPRVAVALGQDAELGLKVGWLLTPDLRAASTSVLDLRVGSLSFPLHGAERPGWISPVLREVAARFLRWDAQEPLETLAGRLLGAMLSPDPARRAAWRRLSLALSEPPFGFGVLELVDPVRPAAAFGPELRRARQFGPAAARSLRLAAAVLLDAPDVLVLDEPVPTAVREWLLARTDGPDATLEQVLLVGGPA